MLIHKWIESLRGNAHQQEVAAAFAKDCVFVDAGDYGDYPEIATEIVTAARPPFPDTCVQFNLAAGRPEDCTFLVFVRSLEAEGTHRVLAAYRRWEDGVWVASDPFDVIREGDRTKVVVHKGLDVFNQWSEVRPEGQVVLPNMFASLAWRIFAVMACSNVRTRDHQPDAALNKKRAKAGKVPLVSYKTLEIAVPNTRYEGGGPGGGTHASPRVHLRRGHIRKIADGKTVWVQACVVGSKHGMVLKDYKLRSAS